MFSSRLPRQLEENAVTRALARLRTAGTPVIDLTETNPTQVGLPYALDLHAVLAAPSALIYAPEPLGLPMARAAAAAEFARQGAAVSAEQVVITASTSDAYAMLFKLLCDAGDEVLVPQPSYPLFDLLSRLDNVRTVPYALEQHAGWALDRASLERGRTARTRAVLVVSPNNPTGSTLRDDDHRWLAAWCAAHDLALIVDEVFLDYPLRAATLTTAAAVSTPALTFTLNGLSKSAGLPQMKLGWMAVTGPEALVASALAQIELIMDTYLAVSTPVQVAAASLIARGVEVRAAILARVSVNLARARAMVAGHPHVSLLEPEAGWCAVLRVPATESEEARVLRLLETRHVLVHPGFFFDFAHEAYLVLSLLPPDDVFADGLARVLDDAHIQ